MKKTLAVLAISGAALTATVSPASAGTTWNSVSLAQVEVVTLAYSVPSCKTVSWWARVIAVLGGGGCR